MEGHEGVDSLQGMKPGCSIDAVDGAPLCKAMKVSTRRGCRAWGMKHECFIEVVDGAPAWKAIKVSNWAV